ncbi:hypothetical protein EJ06DRAFT_557057 [Trichodelitschia bisporula]|uniref:RING-14 protein n=1 Tax=Trichodelitschia bisporula TaxID=703511 RepID=A0A6G1HV83_9PEZI|nr:hypothetical protein EJ06DRAFT_557057 [Trichodelitschia bisporula]
MKFGHIYREELERSFPAQWAASAISYNQLKKCIKRVQRELSALGLDAHTLKQLLETAEAQQKARDSEAAAERAKNEAAPEGSRQCADDEHRPLRYRFADAGPAVVPQLLFLVDEATGAPLDAQLAPETRSLLHRLALEAQLTDLRITPDSPPDSPADSSPRRSIASSSLPPTERSNSDASNVPPNPDSSNDPSPPHSSSSPPTDPSNPSSHPPPTRVIAIPLTSDGEFFTRLQTELFALHSLQETEQARLSTTITSIGTLISRVTDPRTGKAAQHDLVRWRRIFEIYLDSRVFFSATERARGPNDAHKAGEAWSRFGALVAADGGVWKKRESEAAMRGFVEINEGLLRHLRFQELNQTAVGKILKKFDKRTALGASSSLPPLASPASFSASFAKALSAQVSSQIVARVPQLDDYLCPVCFTLAYRPVRLRCKHIFCIRCAIIMQREGRDRCPLCRGHTVLSADSDCIDPNLTKFLRRYFPDEAREKQKANERAAAIDQFGERFVDAKCVVM